MASFRWRVQFLNDTDPFATTVFPEPTRPLLFEFDEYLPLIDQLPDLHRLLNAPHELAQCGLQLSPTGSYLDVEESINDQKECFEGYDKHKKHSVVLRTKLSVRVTGILEKLRTSSGRDLRRALFSLKQLFQDDQDLVHEFISAGGLDCLIQLGMGSDQNHRSYILRALGEIMLFMDGMNGIIEHNQAIQWLYSLLTMQYRLVVKSALKLLIVFVEYAETNSMLFVKALKQEDSDQRRDIGANFMTILSDPEQDSEITTYVISLINKTLSYIPDQDTFYDLTDAFERQGIEEVSQRICSKSNSDLDLVEQFKLYEYALKQEDGEADIPENQRLNLRKARRSLDVTQQRKSLRAGGLKPTAAYSDISKRLSLDTLAPSAAVQQNGDAFSSQRRRREQRRSRDHSDQSASNRPEIPSSPLIVQPPPAPAFQRSEMRVPEVVVQEPTTPTENGYGLHPRRKGRDKLRHAPEDSHLTFIPTTSTAMERRRRRPGKDQNRNYSTSKNEVVETPSNSLSGPTTALNLKDNVVSFRSRREERPTEEDLHRRAAEENQKIAKQSDAREARIHAENSGKNTSIHTENSHEHTSIHTENSGERTSNGILITDDQESQQTSELQNSSADQKEEDQSGLSNGVVSDRLQSAEEEKLDRKISVSLRNSEPINQRIEKLRNSSIDDVTESPSKEVDLENKGTVQLIQDQLKEQSSQDSTEESTTNVSEMAKNLAAFRSKLGKAPVSPEQTEEIPEQPQAPKKKETVTDWMLVLIKNKRKLEIKEWDFRDLTSRDDEDVFNFTVVDSGQSGGAPPPPPPPPMGGGMMPPPPPPPPLGAPPPPPPPPLGMAPLKNNLNDGYMTYPPKGKKTIRLFWRQFNPVPQALLKKNQLDNTIWKSLMDVKLDTRKLETLFESRGKDFLPRKATDSQKKQFITVLNSKRSNAINIGLTVLPHSETIKQAILHMDSLVLTKENVERLLSMAPTTEEIEMIRDAQRESPDTPLGSAEDFLMMLASVGALEARLKLWIFKIDYDSQEGEIAEHLADLKKGIEDLKKSKTFMYILASLRAVGNFLNGANVEGFHIEYLSKVSEVKDTSSSKQSLLFHLCSIIREQFPDSTDFFSEIGTIKRCAKVDFEELETNLLKLEEDCKASWEHLELIYTKHTMSREVYKKTKDLLTDCAQKILVLKVVHVRVLNRFQKLLLFLGMNSTAAQELKVTNFCMIVSEFALEYRTARERLIEIEKKKEDQKKRNKTRGKMITEKFLSKEKTDDAELKALLTTRGTAPGDETLESRTRARPSNRKTQSMQSAEPEEDEQTEELLTMLVKTSKDSANTRRPRKRERTRHSNRKSLRRTLKSGLTDAEKAALGLMPKSPTLKI